MFGGYREATNLPTTINAPICQTTPISLNLIGNQYLDSSVSPNIAFGSITNYRYQIPSGWYLNSTLSNGSTWITANGSVTLTPDSSTSGVVNYIAKSDCSNAFIEGSQRTIYK